MTDGVERIVVVEPDISVVEVGDQVEVTERVISEVVEVAVAGGKGGKGDKGDKGDQGDQGIPGSGTFQFDYSQLLPSDTWVIVHNLGAAPNVTITDSSGSQVEGEVTYDSPNQVTVRFASAFSGTAHLS